VINEILFAVTILRSG